MDRLCRGMIATELPMLLRFEDRNSMAHGIEARVPFLDYRLVEWAMRLGGQFNIRDGQSKWILRQAAASVLPPEVLARRDKIGFATPEAQWLQGPLRAKAAAGLADTFETLAGHIDVDRARLETRAMLDGRRAYDPALWRLWCVVLWAARFGVAIER
jgi:asparagine synthase (glutamine-hydrolysing)